MSEVGTEKVSMLLTKPAYMVVTGNYEDYEVSCVFGSLDDAKSYLEREFPGRMLCQEEDEPHVWRMLTGREDTFAVGYAPRIETIGFVPARKSV